MHYFDRNVTLHHGDCIEVMASLPDSSVDSICTDPPYGLGFMGKAWDDLPPGEDWARECLRVLKPGGHLLAFGGTRTWHRLACAVEDAGFEVRDSIAWLYGSGFPKSHDVSKAIDKAAGAEREVVGPNPYNANKGGRDHDSALCRQAGKLSDVTAPATDAAREWAGWGTALKPAFEPVVVARKPLAAGTVAANVQAWGTGALNIDGSRIEASDKAKFPAGIVSDTERVFGGGAGRYADRPRTEDSTPGGRWPANVILDEDMAGVLDEQSGTFAGVAGGMRQVEGKVTFTVGEEINAKKFTRGTPDHGGASRFFYVAKAPKKERPVVDGVAHPTVKPLALMRWLVRLVTPPGGTVLEPFAGSGTTVEACLLEGFHCIAIEKGDEYLPLILARIQRQDTARIVEEVARVVDVDAAILEQIAEPAKRGRWPANVLLDPEMAAVLDEQSGIDTSRPQGRPSVGTIKPTDATSFSGVNSGVGYTDTGGASRFFGVMPYDEPTLFDDGLGA